MIVSHEHRFIFLKPRKVAGTSFEIALSKYLTDDDIITPVEPRDELLRRKLGFTGARNFNHWPAQLLVGNKRLRFRGRKLPLRYFNHMSAWQVKNRLPGEVWDNYAKISIVRNPWDRAVSSFFWKARKGKAEADLAEFTDYFRRKPKLLEINYPNYMIDGENVVDHFIRYEHFEADIRKLEWEIPALNGLWDIFRNIRTKGSTRTKTITTAEIFAQNPEIDALVRERNDWEIEKFGYSLD